MCSNLVHQFWDQCIQQDRIEDAIRSNTILITLVGLRLERVNAHTQFHAFARFETLRTSVTDMKTMICIVLFLATFLVLKANAEFISSVAYDGTIGEFLHRLELFEDYGNKQKLIDPEKQLVKFQHQHEDGSLTSKIYKLEIVEPSDHVIEFHVSYQKPQVADTKNLANEVNDQEIHIDKAIKSLMEFRLPKDHSYAGIWGKRETYTINGLKEDENGRVVATETSTPIRLSIDDDTSEVKRIDFLSISRTPEGFVGTIKTMFPEDPINWINMNSREQREFLEELLMKNVDLESKTLDSDEPANVDSHVPQS